ncbi:hypothetical protein D3C76_1505850 [compost metagenome]
MSSCTSIARLTVDSSAKGVWLGHKVIRLAPLSRTRLAVISRSLERPDWEMHTATSPGLKVTADIACMCGSEYAAALSSRRKNLCWASAATAPDAPKP